MKDDIKLSPELQRFMEYHSIPNLVELLKIDDEKLLEMDLFGWRLMREVLVLREF
ncbi:MULTISPECIES: hypothetical protein [unclassified Flavobacterium]|jgi:hypothetical protein|uniref:hypothetical protein n=1 Tax=unclassified Flavobacterium TaxID=196869 RepID=UPI0025C19EA9|nr:MULTISPECIES: hypothetical protein [unclassified Flavobacterium]